MRAARGRLFAAISAYDSTAIRAVCTPDYVLLEDGVVWNVDSLVNTVNGLRNEKLRIDYSFEDDVIRVEGAFAWMTYRNRGILSGAEEADTLDWVESALFRKEEETWRMILLHSARVNIDR